MDLARTLSYCEICMVLQALVVLDMTSIPLTSALAVSSDAEGSDSSDDDDDNLTLKQGPTRARISPATPHPQHSKGTPTKWEINPCSS